MIVSKKIPADIKKYLPKLYKVLCREPNVILTYIFGSYARGKTNPLSDFDIAILPSDNPPKNLESRLFSAISKILHTDEIDLIILDNVPVGLQFNILKEGTLFLCKDESKRKEFQEIVISNYLDTSPIRNEIFFHLKERL